MTVADFIDRVDCPGQLICIRTRHEFSYFEGMVRDLRESPVKMKSVKNLPVIGIDTIASFDEAWIVITVTED